LEVVIIFRGLALVIAVIWTAGASSADSRSKLGDMWLCLGHKIPERRWNGYDLVPRGSIDFSSSEIFVHGFLGWHLSWGVLFDVSDSDLVAYETYGSKGDASGAFGRIEVPSVLSEAIVECGVEWKGLWPNEWPQANNRAPASATDRYDRFEGLSPEDLLPQHQ
jgi:hypothetical protein